MNTYSFLVRIDVLIHAESEEAAWDIFEAENPGYVDAEIVAVH